MKTDKCSTEITLDFLRSDGWIIDEDLPLYQSYKHPRLNNDYELRISAYGAFSLTCSHWCNKTELEEGVILNGLCRIKDYDRVLKLLKIYNKIKNK